MQHLESLTDLFAQTPPEKQVGYVAFKSHSGSKVGNGFYKCKRFVKFLIIFLLQLEHDRESVGDGHGLAVLHARLPVRGGADDADSPMPAALQAGDVFQLRAQYRYGPDGRTGGRSGPLPETGGRKRKMVQAGRSCRPGTGVTAKARRPVRSP